MTRPTDAPPPPARRYTVNPYTRPYRLETAEWERMP